MRCSMGQSLHVKRHLGGAGTHAAGVRDNIGKHHICSAFAKGVILSAESMRAKRYGQQKICNVSALERIMLMKLRCGFCK